MCYSHLLLKAQRAWKASLQANSLVQYQCLKTQKLP